MSNPLDTKMFGKTLAQWAPMTPEQRSADSRINGQANKLKALQEAIDAATKKLADAVREARPAAPAVEPPVEGPIAPPPAELPPVAPEPETTPVAESPAAESDDSTEPARPVSIETVFRQLATRPPAVKVRTRILECRLTPAQAEVHAKLQAILQQHGVHARRAGDVYGWLLDQVAKSVAGE